METVARLRERSASIGHVGGEWGRTAWRACAGPPLTGGLPNILICEGTLTFRVALWPSLCGFSLIVLLLDSSAIPAAPIVWTVLLCHTAHTHDDTDYHILHTHAIDMSRRLRYMLYIDIEILYRGGYFICTCDGVSAALSRSR